MCPTAEPVRPRPSAGFTLLELLVVLVIMGVLVALGAGSFSVERNPLYAGAQSLVTAVSTARSRALLLNAPVTLELGQDALEIASGDGGKPLRETFPKGMSAMSVDEHYLLRRLGSCCCSILSAWCRSTSSIFNPGRIRFPRLRPTQERPASSRASSRWNRFAKEFL